MGFRDVFRRSREPRSGTPAEGDRLVIEQLKRAGADLSHPREVDHYLYMPTEDAANEAGKTLKREGYRVEVTLSAEAKEGEPNPWLVHARTEAVVDAEMIDGARARFEELAAAYGGEYDGWGAAAD